MKLSTLRPTPNPVVSGRRDGDPNKEGFGAYLASDALDEHYALTSSEKPVLALVARGASDRDIEAELALTGVGLHSCLRRFRERTGLTGRLLVAWSARHGECCIAA